MNDMTGKVSLPIPTYILNERIQYWIFINSKNKYTYFTSAHEKKRTNFTKTALHRLELCGVAWASGGRHSYSNSSLKSPEDLSNQKLSISRQEGVHNKAPSISIMLEARYSKSKSSLQSNQSLHLLLTNWKRSSNRLENEISSPQVNKLSSSPSS